MRTEPRPLSKLGAIELAISYREAVDGGGGLVYLHPESEDICAFSELPPGARVISLGFYDKEMAFHPWLQDFGRKAK